MGAMRDHADADDEFSANHARREHDAFARVDAAQQLAVVIGRVENPSPILEGEDAELRLGHDLDPLDLPQLLGRVRGEIELLVELLAERLDAEELEGQPDAQTA